MIFLVTGLDTVSSHHLISGILIEQSPEIEGKENAEKEDPDSFGIEFTVNRSIFCFVPKSDFTKIYFTDIFPENKLLLTIWQPPESA